MAYERTEWQKGMVLTAENLNKIENALAGISSVVNVETDSSGVSTTGTTTGSLQVTGTAQLGETNISGTANINGATTIGTQETAANLTVNGNIIGTGAVSATNATMTGEVSAASAAITGTITGGNITTTGGVNAGSIIGTNLTVGLSSTDEDTNEITYDGNVTFNTETTAFNNGFTVGSVTENNNVNTYTGTATFNTANTIIHGSTAIDYLEATSVKIGTFDINNAVWSNAVFDAQEKTNYLYGTTTINQLITPNTAIQANKGLIIESESSSSSSYPTISLTNTTNYNITNLTLNNESICFKKTSLNYNTTEYYIFNGYTLKYTPDINANSLNNSYQILNYIPTTNIVTIGNLNKAYNYDHLGVANVRLEGYSICLETYSNTLPNEDKDTDSAGIIGMHGHVRIGESEANTHKGTKLTLSVYGDLYCGERIEESNGDITYNKNAYFYTNTNTFYNDTIFGVATTDEENDVTTYAGTATFNTATTTINGTTTINNLIIGSTIDINSAIVSIYTGNLIFDNPSNAGQSLIFKAKANKQLSEGAGITTNSLTYELKTESKNLSLIANQTYSDQTVHLTNILTYSPVVNNLASLGGSTLVIGDNNSGETTTSPINNVTIQAGTSITLSIGTTTKTTLTLNESALDTLSNLLTST